jgi:DNA recombination protein RmuC
VTVEALVGFLGGCLAAICVAVPFALRHASRRYEAGRVTREPELALLDERIDELRLALDAAQADVRREHERVRMLEQQLHAFARDHAETRGRLARQEQLERSLGTREQELAQARDRLEGALTAAATLETRLAEEVRKSQERLGFLEQVRAEFSDTFKSLAGEVLEDKSRRLLVENAAQMGHLLTPVREQLKSFQDVVQSAYVAEARERSLLGREIDTLKLLNREVNQETANLTRALRGDNRVQGAWGEMVLERLLEAAGLSEGREFTSQGVIQDDDGSRPRPDVVVHLPEKRDLVIDSKVALVAYERALHAVDDSARASAVQEHVAALKRHVDGLARRDYAQLLAGRTLDFVLMFVPVESALIEAIRSDGGLYEHALERNIAIVSPSTLMVTLRAVAHLWKQEQRSHNAQEIARRAGRLYDKFVAFVEDLESARSALSRAQRELDQALSKLNRGSGNLVRQAEQLRELGARNHKQLPDAVLGEALEWGDESGTS